MVKYQHTYYMGTLNAFIIINYKNKIKLQIILNAFATALQSAPLPCQ